jgi:hypothetical protein
VKAAAGFALYDLMMGWCFFGTLIGALEAAKAARTGYGGYAVAIIVGVSLGAGGVWTMWSVAMAVGTSAERPDSGYSDSHKEWIFRALYFSAMLWVIMWIAFASILGRWVLSALMRLNV